MENVSASHSEGTDSCCWRRLSLTVHKGVVMKWFGDYLKVTVTFKNTLSYVHLM